jgi:hypothetical protein
MEMLIAMPMDTMFPMPPPIPPPVGFQLVRDPTTGQILFLPTTTTIGEFIFLICINLFGNWFQVKILLSSLLIKIICRINYHSAPITD